MTTKRKTSKSVAMPQALYDQVAALQRLIEQGQRDFLEEMRAEGRRAQQRHQLAAETMREGREVYERQAKAWERIASALETIATKGAGSGLPSNGPPA